jgi:hypothetical protein
VNQTSAKGKETREDLQKMIWTEEEGSAVDREGQSQRMLCLRVTRGGGESEGKECEEESGDSDGNECCETKKKATGTGERSDGQEATVVDQKIESEDKSERSKEMFEKDKHREGDREEEILPLGRLVRSERRDRERETERQRETERDRERETERERQRERGERVFTLLAKSRHRMRIPRSMALYWKWILSTRRRPALATVKR